jgi:5'(3')-deoxyribonucleotidase
MQGTDRDQVALIDLDGTVADYDEAIVREMRAIQSPEEAPFGSQHGAREVPFVEARRKLIQRQPGFWRKLKPIARGFEVVEDLRSLKFSLHVLTKGPTSTPSAWSEKVEWCQEYLADATVTVTGDKSLVYGRILFDDYPPYFLEWLEVRPRGLVVCLAHPWNEGFAKGGRDERPNVLRYDGTNRDELREALRRAHDRVAGSGAQPE